MAGSLVISVRPWAGVSVDGTVVGQTPLQPLELTPGVHTIELSHPDYRPLMRRLVVRPGEVTRLQIDLTREASPRP